MTAGEKFEDWTYISDSVDRKHYGVFKCKCGTIKEIYKYNVLSGKSKRCKACQNNKTAAKNGDYAKIHRAWYRAVSRCENPKNQSYRRYGGRGICICDEWKNNPDNFVNWAVSNGWEDGLSLERIDNDGDYCPENCRWATAKEQARNRSLNVVIEHNGEVHCLSEWCEILGIPDYLARNRYRRGQRNFDTVFFPGYLYGGGKNFRR